MRYLKTCHSLLIVILGLVAPSFGFASSKLHPHAEELKAAKEQSLTLARFNGHAGFMSATSIQWKKIGQHYFPDGQIFTKRLIGASGCESLLAIHQDFPLKKMMASGYLPPTDFQKYIAMSLNFNPAVVSFAVANRDLPVAKAAQLFGEDWRSRLNPFFDSYADENSPSSVGTFVTATMWNVSGQYLDTSTAMIRQHALPWQHDPRRAELAKQFDRKKYPVVFEWGRTAQDLPNEFPPLASMLSALNFSETIALGRRVEDAYIMFHSFDKLNTKLYSRYFPGRLFPQGWSDENDALFLVPLVEAMKVFPPNAYLGRIKTIVDHSQGRIDEKRALNFLLAMEMIRLSHLDMKHASGVRYPHPLVVQDLSSAVAQRRAQTVRAFGLDPMGDEARKVAEFLGKYPLQFPTWNPGYYVDLADLDLTQYEMDHENAIEVSNLDAEVAKVDSQYVKRVLFGILGRHLTLLGGTDETSQRQALHWLREQKVQIALATFNDFLVQRIRALQPKKEKVLAAAETDEALLTSISREASTRFAFRGHLHSQYLFFFTIDQILVLGQQDPTLFSQARTLIQENMWASEQILSAPAPF